MAKDEPYDIMPHREIVELKKQVQELKSEKSSSQGLVSSMSALTNSMDSMLRLFKGASEELKVEEKEDILNKKLDEIIEQNKIIADGIVTVSDMIKNSVQKQKEPEPMKVQPSFQPPTPQPDFQQPPLESLPNEPGVDLGPIPEQGPVAMPSVPFSSLEEPPKPKKKKGLFGRLKQ